MICSWRLTGENAMSIRHEIIFKCKAPSVFNALVQAERFGELTSAAAEMNAEPGGWFSCFDGMITGMNIEIVTDERLVQAWRVSVWPPGVYSLVRFELEEISDEETRLVFDHAGFPEEHGDHLERGWHEKYWNPMKKYLEA